MLPCSRFSLPKHGHRRHPLNPPITTSGVDASDIWCVPETVPESESGTPPPILVFTPLWRKNDTFPLLHMHNPFQVHAGVERAKDNPRRGSNPRYSDVLLRNRLEV